MSGARMRRIVCWGVSAGLTASLCVFSPPAAVAEVGAGPAADAAADWLVAQLNEEDHLLRQDGEPDIGLTMDAVFSLQNIGGHDDAVTEMKAAIEVRRLRTTSTETSTTMPMRSPKLLRTPDG